MSANIEPTGVDTSADAGRPGMGLGAGALPRPRKRFPTQLVILMLVVGVGAGALYGMRRYGTSSGLILDKSLDVDFKPGDEEKARSYERIMAELNRLQQPLDVALTDFGKSPFMLDNSGPSVTPDVDVVPKAGASDDERHLAEAVAMLKQMHLNSIVGGIARIDDQNVRVGDRVNDIFTVKAIDGRSVTFEAYGQEMTLTMEVGKSSAPKQQHGPAKMRAGGR